MEISFISQASYEPIATGPAPKIEKPSIVPLLNMDKVLKE